MSSESDSSRAVEDSHILSKSQLMEKLRGAQVDFDSKALKPELQALWTLHNLGFLKEGASPNEDTVEVIAGWWLSTAKELAAEVAHKGLTTPGRRPLKCDQIAELAKAYMALHKSSPIVAPLENKHTASPQKEVKSKTTPDEKEEGTTNFNDEARDQRRVERIPEDQDDLDSGPVAADQKDGGKHDTGSGFNDASDVHLGIDNSSSQDVHTSPGVAESSTNRMDSKYLELAKSIRSNPSAVNMLIGSCVLLWIDQEAGEGKWTEKLPRAEWEEYAISPNDLNEYKLGRAAKSDEDLAQALREMPTRLQTVLFRICSKISPFLKPAPHDLEISLFEAADQFIFTPEEEVKKPESGPDRMLLFYGSQLSMLCMILTSGSKPGGYGHHFTTTTGEEAYSCYFWGSAKAFPQNHDLYRAFEQFANFEIPYGHNGVIFGCEYPRFRKHDWYGIEPSLEPRHHLNYEESKDLSIRYVFILPNEVLWPGPAGKLVAPEAEDLRPLMFKAFDSEEFNQPT